MHDYVISSKYKRFDAAFLKNLAIISMLVDHTALALLYNSYIKLNLPLTRGSFQYHLYTLYKILRGFGRLAFPIFCFFLVEGFIYTHSRIQYLIRLVLFGIVSEPVFDLALRGSFPYPKHENVMFEMALGLLMLWVFESVERLPLHPDELRLALQFAAVVPFIVAAQKLHLDYGFKGLLLILLLYALRSQRLLQCIGGAIFISLWEWPAVFSFAALALYNGQRGKQAKYFFYIFYPGHLLLLTLISQYLTKAG